MNKTKEKAYNLIHKEIERFFRDECKVDGKTVTWTLYNRSITNLKGFVGEKLGEAFELLIKQAKKEVFDDIETHTHKSPCCFDKKIVWFGMSNKVFYYLKKKHKVVE